MTKPENMNGYDGYDGYGLTNKKNMTKYRKLINLL